MKSAFLRLGLVTLLMAAVAVAAASQGQGGKPPVEAPVQVAPGVWFQQHHDIGAYGSNVAWIEFSDYVAVVDTAFPRGAEEALRHIKATTKGKPIRYAIVTHYHSDHSFGSGAFAREGAAIVAHENARREYLARNVAAYARSAERDPTYAKYPSTAPDVTFTDTFVLDDGRRRAEIYYFGHAHTTGCIFTFLPRERVVFTGDACVNGPFNYLGDSDTASWIDVLTQVEALDPEVVVPGHGPVGRRDLLRTQKQYFVELRAQVARLVAEGKTLDEAKKAVDIPMWKAWTGQTRMSEAHIAHVYGELTRGPLTWAGGDPGQPGRSVVALPMEKGKERPRLKMLVGKLSNEDRAGLAARAPNVEFIEARDREEALRHAPEVHAAVGQFVTPEFLRRAEQLRWVQQFSAGVEHLVSLPELRDNDRVVLTNMKAMFGPPIADHVIGMLLAFTRSLPHYHDLMKEGRWGRGADAPYQGELQGKTMLVVGLGGNGLETARRAHAFGMRVLATDPKEIAVPRFVSRLDKPDRLKALLPAADVVVLACPLTPETERLFGPAEFALMKEGSFFINIARGKVVDTAALLEAVRSKKLAGAGLDVTDPEPLPPDHPLWKEPRVLITPHVSGQSPGTRFRVRQLFLENVRRFASGEPLLNVVDKKAGY